MKKILCVVLLSVSCIALAAMTETTTFDVSKIKSLDITNMSGEVEVKATQSTKAKVKTEKIEFSKNCILKTELKNSTLEIKVERASGFKKGNCRVDFDIAVPAKVAVNVKSGSGDIEVKGTQGKIDAKIGSGEIDIEARVEELEANTGSGDIEVKGLIGNANIQAGSGDVKLTYQQCPSDGTVDIRTGSGDVLLKLPSSSVVSTSLKTGSGRVTNEFGDSDKAKLKVSMRTGSGNISIKKVN